MLSALLNFFTTYVIHSEVLRFRKRVQNVESLDHLITLHEEQWVYISLSTRKLLTLHISIERIEGRCLLQPKVRTFIL